MCQACLADPRLPRRHRTGVVRRCPGCRYPRCRLLRPAIHPVGVRSRRHGSAARAIGADGRLWVLPAESRMRRRRDFSAAVRRGSRSGRALLTGHLLVPSGEEDSPPRAGLVVSRSVGPAVVRNKVRRRLRVLVREYLSSLPGGSLLVVRAHPQAATARQADLAADLDLVINTLMRRQAGALRQ